MLCALQKQQKKQNKKKEKDEKIKHGAKNFVGLNDHSPRTVFAVPRPNKIIKKYAQSLYLEVLCATQDVK